MARWVISQVIDEQASASAQRHFLDLNQYQSNSEPIAGNLGSVRESGGLVRHSAGLEAATAARQVASRCSDTLLLCNRVLSLHSCLPLL